MNDKLDEFRRQVRAEFELTQGLLRSTITRQEQQGEQLSFQGEQLTIQGEQIGQQREFSRQQRDFNRQQVEFNRQQVEILRQQGEILGRQGETLGRQGETLGRQGEILERQVELVEGLLQNQLEGVRDFRRMQEGMERIATLVDQALDSVMEAPTRAELESIERRVRALEEQRDAA